MIAPRGSIPAEQEPPLCCEEAAKSGVREARFPGILHTDRGESETETDSDRPFWLRMLFALNVVGAGGPGILILAAPDRAEDLLFAGDVTSDAATRVLGCVWIAIGVLSVAGLICPLRFSPVLLVQFAYKLIWLIVVAIPAVTFGEPVSLVLTAIFAGWVIAVGAAAPWKLLVTPETASTRNLSQTRRSPSPNGFSLVEKP